MAAERAAWPEAENALCTVLCVDVPADSAATPARESVRLIRRALSIFLAGVTANAQDSPLQENLAIVVYGGARLRGEGAGAASGCFVLAPLTNDYARVAAVVERLEHDVSAESHLAMGLALTRQQLAGRPMALVECATRSHMHLAHRVLLFSGRMPLEGTRQQVLAEAYNFSSNASMVGLAAPCPVACVYLQPSEDPVIGADAPLCRLVANTTGGMLVHVEHISQLFHFMSKHALVLRRVADCMRAPRDVLQPRSFSLFLLSKGWPVRQGEDAQWDAFMLKLCSVDATATARSGYEPQRASLRSVAAYSSRLTMPPVSYASESRPLTVSQPARGRSMQRLSTTCICVGGTSCALLISGAAVALMMGLDCTPNTSPQLFSASFCSRLPPDAPLVLFIAGITMLLVAPVLVFLLTFRVCMNDASSSAAPQETTPLLVSQSRAPTQLAVS